MTRSSGRDRDRDTWLSSLLSFGVASFVLLSVTLVPGLVFLKIDASQNALFDPADPDVETYRKVIETFGSDYVSIVYFEDSELLSREKILLLSDFAARVAALDDVEKVESILSITALDAGADGEDGDTIHVAPFLEAGGAVPTDLSRIRERASEHPYVGGFFLAADGTATTIVVHFRSDLDDANFSTRAYESLERLMTPLRSSFERLFQLGAPRFFVETRDGIERDLARLTPLAALILFLVLAGGYWSLTAGLLPLLTGLVSAAWTFGAMGWLGVPINIMSGALPLLLLAVGSTEDTHLFARYASLEALGDSPESRSARGARLLSVARSAALPTLLTGFTTTLAFAFGMLSGLRILADFGLAAAIGMALNLLATILIVPFWLSVVGASPRRGRLRAAFEKLAVRSIRYIAPRSRLILGAFCVLGLVLIAVSTQVRINNDALAHLSKDHPIVRDVSTVDSRIAGTQMFYLTMRGPGPDYFLDPDHLEILARLQIALQDIEPSFKSFSIVDLLKYLNRELNGGADEAYRLPENREAVSQYLLLVSQSELDPLIDQDYSAVNVVVRHGVYDSETLLERVSRLESIVAEALPAGAAYSVIGKNLMIHRASYALVTSSMIAFVILALVIFSCVSLAFGSARLGAVVLVPNLAPAVGVLSFMVVSGMSIGATTATVAIIALGVAVDDAIHFVGYYRSRKRELDRAAALEAAMVHQLKVVFLTSVALCSGFLIFAFSEFQSLVEFGLLCALAFAIGLFSNVLVTPCALIVADSIEALGPEGPNRL